MGNKYGFFSMDLRRQWVVSAQVNIGNIAVGYAIAWSAPVIPKLQDVDQTPLPESLPLSELGLVASCITIGTVLGAFISSWISNKFGRKIALILGGTTSFLGYSIISVANHLGHIIAGRIIAGLGLGAIGVMSLVYIGEISSPEIRGILLTCSGVFHVFGNLIVYSIGPYISYARVGYLFLIISGLFTFICFYIPESPLYCVMKGNRDSAAKILNYLERSKDIDGEIQNLIEVAAETDKNWSLQEILRIRSNRRSLLITIATYVFQECSGLVAVMFFATTIFQKAGSSIKPDVATIIVGIVQFATTIVVPTYIEKLGRKTLLLISTGGCGICMVVMGIYFYFDYLQYPFINSVRWLPLVLMLLSYVSYGTGLGVIPNTLIGEMFRPNVRSIGASISLTSGWLTSIVTIASFGYIVEALGSFVMFWIFAGVNAVGFIFTMVAVPETKGMTLREIEIMMAK